VEPMDCYETDTHDVIVFPERKTHLLLAKGTLQNNWSIAAPNIPHMHADYIAEAGELRVTLPGRQQAHTYTGAKPFVP
jgi:hypothetical protein